MCQVTLNKPFISDAVSYSKGNRQLYQGKKHQVAFKKENPVHIFIKAVGFKQYRFQFLITKFYNDENKNCDLDY